MHRNNNMTTQQNLNNSLRIEFELCAYLIIKLK